MNHGNSSTVTTDDRAHPDQGCAAAPLTLAVQATAMYVRALTEYYASIGRALPDLSVGDR